MAKLYFFYGVMGSSKTVSALMVDHNYIERGQKALLAKPKADQRNGEHLMWTRLGITKQCLYTEELFELPDDTLKEYNCIVIDEAQFLSTSDVNKLARIVDDLDIPVMCYGLRADFQGNFFEGSRRLMEIADSIEEIKTICWCGRKATFNARIDTNGNVVKSGEQFLLGDNDRYIGLCRKHWKSGNLGNKE